MIKDVLHLSTHYSVLARIVFVISGNIRQIATCKQHVPSKECCNLHRPSHLLTAILNANHTLDIVQESDTLKGRHDILQLYECRLNITMKGKLYFYRKKRCMFRGLLYFVGILFFEKSNALS